jgi:predicted nucleic acid-binding protein
VTAVVIDASAGVEIVGDTRRGRALARLLTADSEGWVPEHFYAEVLGVLRRRLLIERRSLNRRQRRRLADSDRGISTEPH